MSRETVRDHNDWQAAESWQASRDYIPEEIDWRDGVESEDDTFSAEKDGSLDGVKGSGLSA